MHLCTAYEDVVYTRLLENLCHSVRCFEKWGWSPLHANNCTMKPDCLCSWRSRPRPFSKQQMTNEVPALYIRPPSVTNGHRRLRGVCCTSCIADSSPPCSSPLISLRHQTCQSYHYAQALCAKHAKVPFILFCLKVRFLFCDALNAWIRGLCTSAIAPFHRTTHLVVPHIVPPCAKHDQRPTPTFCLRDVCLLSCIDGSPALLPTSHLSSLQDLPVVLLYSDSFCKAYKRSIYTIVFESQFPFARCIGKWDLSTLHVHDCTIRPGCLCWEFVLEMFSEHTHEKRGSSRIHPSAQHDQRPAPTLRLRVGGCCISCIVASSPLLSSPSTDLVTRLADGTATRGLCVQSMQTFGVEHFLQKPVTFRTTRCAWMSGLYRPRIAPLHVPILVMALPSYSRMPSMINDLLRFPV